MAIGKVRELRIAVSVVIFTVYTFVKLKDSN